MEGSGNASPPNSPAMNSKEDIQITAVDQERINSFAKWNIKRQEYETQVETTKKALQNLNDLEDELVVSDAEVHPYKIGESFFHLSPDDTNDKISEGKTQLKERLIALESDLGDCKAAMATLKKELYAKFGDNINLEES